MTLIKNFKFQNQDAIVIIDGSYRGWIGYAQGNEENGYIKVKLFASNGEVALIDEFFIADVKNIEPMPRLPLWNQF